MKVLSDYYSKGIPFLPLIMVSSLFLMWAVANRMNGILIKHFKTALNLSKGEAVFVATSFYLAYFIMAILTSLFIGRYEYKKVFYLDCRFLPPGLFAA